mmetsp:Transcript_11634/g.29619  ORF Transcript_11634/g.29619 Transcript_11634/m.29619 type:complete len:580 (+) Transcript_11634:194-1933(+)
MAAGRGLGSKKRKLATKDAGEGEYKPVEVQGEVFREGIIGKDATIRAKEEFQTSEPYPHFVLNDVVDQTRLRAVRDEIIHNLKATFKETDIYKVLQTGDLANMDGLDEASLKQLPNLKKLRDTLYSQSFREFLENVTGCGKLIDKTDGSCNIYPQGGHLLCHDDVIGTRRVSYILYLTEPGEQWLSEYGGALELYDCIGGSNGAGKAEKLPIPESHPCKKILPQWNSMVLFAVLPGRSFHAIEEVVAVDKPRLSISGWFHGETPPKGYENASLNQIIVDQNGNEMEGRGKQFSPLKQSISPFGDSEWLSEADVALLSEFINRDYLVQSSVKRIAEKFVDESHIQLHAFLREEYASRITATLKMVDEAGGLFDNAIPSHSVGVSKSWQVRGPTHKQRFLEFAGDGCVGEDPCSVLVELQKKCLLSGAFQRLVSSMSKVILNSARGSIRRFRPGLDYTMAHSGVQTAGYQLDATLCFVQANDQWSLGEVGGYDCYMVNDGDGGSGYNNEHAEVYRAAAENEDDETVTLPATGNCLNLVLCNEGVMRFTKYISADAGGSRWDILNEYQITTEDDDDEDDDDE